MTKTTLEPRIPEAALLAAIVESADDAIISKELDGTITSWNKGAERIFGYLTSEAIGRSISMVIPSDRLDEEPAILARIRKGDHVEHYLTVRRRKDRSFFDASITASLIMNSGGEVIGASNIVRDISEERRAQEQLRRSEERFRVTLSSIGDGVIATDRQGRISFMNRIAEKLTGWNQEDALGLSSDEVFKIINEFSREAIESPVARVLREGTIVGLANHTLLVSKSGAQVPIADSGAPVREVTGELNGVVLVFRDVSEQREAELTARRMAAIVANSDDAIISKTLEGIIESWNEGAERIFGYTATEAIGKSILMIIPQEHRNEEAEILARIRRGERVDHFETVRVTKDGRRINASVTISPIKDPNSGRVIGASKILRDITERKKSEEALRKAQEQLQAQAQQLKSTVNERTEELRQTVSELEAFSYSLSHDLRTPLRAIQSFAQIVLADNGARIGPPGTDYLERVVNASERMDRLIRDVLTFTRVSREEVRFERVDVDRLIRDIIKERQDWQPPAAVIQIESPLLPMCGHQTFLTQCIMNLLDNAIKFVSPETSPHVQIYSETLGDKVRLWFQDHGIGIEKSAQEKVFKVFQRAHIGGRYEGTGIGLAVVRRAVERMDGTVGVESEPGRGSRFWIELPGVGS
jgi:PAS domain S-box-containing protein